jgi:AcrR family transcriptional regulator
LGRSAPPDLAPVAPPLTPPLRRGTIVGSMSKSPRPAKEARVSREAREAAPGPKDGDADASNGRRRVGGGRSNAARTVPPVRARRGAVPSRGAEDIRSGIIEAVTDILARRGLQAATIKEVAKAAGISPGLIYHYFEDKDRLMLAVLHEASERYRGRAGEFAASVLHGHDAYLPNAAGNEQSRLYHRLRYELLVMGLRDLRLLPDLAVLLERDWRAIRRAFESSGRRDIEGLSSVLLACFDGLALQRMADPGLDVEPAYGLIALVLARTRHPYTLAPTIRKEFDT